MRLFLKIFLQLLFAVIFLCETVIGDDKQNDSLCSKKVCTPKFFAVALGKVDNKKLHNSANLCDLIILSPTSYPKIPSVLKEMNKKITILGYCETMSSDVDNEEFVELNKHEDWFLHDGNGRRINVYVNKTNKRFGMDKTKEGYQDWLANKCKKIIEAGYDGIFLDNLGVVFGYKNPFKYSGFPVGIENFNWQRGSIKLLEKVKAAVGKRNIVVFNQISVDDNSKLLGLIKNNNGMDAMTASISFADACDGAMKENFFDNGKQINEDAPKFLNLLNILNKKNKYTLCLSRGNSAREAKTLYCLYLLALNGENSFFSYQIDYKTINWFDFYEKDLGSPLNDYSNYNGIGMREYMNGLVVVNFSNIIKLVNLPGEFSNDEGQKVKTLTLNGKTGELLFK